MTPSVQSYDLATVKAAAGGQWAHILSSYRRRHTTIEVRDAKQVQTLAYEMAGIAWPEEVSA